MDIATWIVIGLLIACCVVPMLLMSRRGLHRWLGLLIAIQIAFFGPLSIE